MDDAGILAEVDATIAALERNVCAEIMPGGFGDIIALRAARIVADYVMYCPEAPLGEGFRAAMVERLRR